MRGQKGPLEGTAAVALEVQGVTQRVEGSHHEENSGEALGGSSAQLQQ